MLAKAIASKCPFSERTPRCLPDLLLFSTSLLTPDDLVSWTAPLETFLRKKTAADFDLMLSRPDLRLFPLHFLGSVG